MIISTILTVVQRLDQIYNLLILSFLNGKCYRERPKKQSHYLIIIILVIIKIRYHHYLNCPFSIKFLIPWPINILNGDFLLIAGAEGNVESDFHAGTNYIQIKKHLLKTFALSYPMIQELIMYSYKPKKTIYY